MKYLLALLLFCSVTKADMTGFSVGFSPSSSPFFVYDYEFVKDLLYIDLGLGLNGDFTQPFISTGLQFEHINIGIQSAISFYDHTSQVGIGPEFGYMQNLTDLLYVKGGTSLLFDTKSGVGAFSFTLGLGFNL